MNKQINPDNFLLTFSNEEEARYNALSLSVFNQLIFTVIGYNGTPNLFHVEVDGETPTGRIIAQYSKGKEVTKEVQA